MKDLTRDPANRSSTMPTPQSPWRIWRG